jgi:hypothetical protein
LTPLPYVPAGIEQGQVMWFQLMPKPPFSEIGFYTPSVSILFDHDITVAGMLPTLPSLALS